jgi:hypothetical protein
MQAYEPRLRSKATINANSPDCLSKTISTRRTQKKSLKSVFPHKLTFINHIEKLLFIYETIK